MEVRTVTCHLVDENNIYLYSVERRSYGYRHVAVAPPEVPAGMAAVWQSGLNPASDIDWCNTGAWVTELDNRKVDLYTEDGRYEVGSDFHGQSYNGIGAMPSWLSTIEPPAPDPSLEDVKAEKLTEINRDFETAVAALTAGYPPGEQLTWGMQQTEAVAWGLDASTPTPYLDGLAAARGIDAVEMRQKTLDQTRLFMDASQVLVGTRQRLRDLIEVADTKEAVAAVVWSVSL